MTDTDIDHWEVEYVTSFLPRRTSRAVLDIPSGIEVEELMVFPGVDRDTHEAVRVRWEGEDWAAAPEFEIAFLGVRCDAPTGCDLTFSGDYKVREIDDRATRLGCVLDHAAREGWRVEGRENPLTAKTFCPRHG